MKEVIRDFKRHYHRVKEVATFLAEAGSFKFEIKFEAKFGGDSLHTMSATPNDEETVRFASLMHRFLESTDRLYYKSVWTSLQLRFGLEISDDEVKRIEALIHRLEKGDNHIIYNNDKLTPERIYRTISDGGFFYSDEETRKLIEQMSQAPMTAHLLQYEFFDYSVRGFYVVSALFDLILRFEQGAKIDLSDDESIENCCIYCLDTKGTFTSEEHVIAESLGNDDLVLPKGFVCDGCNNGVLSILDNALLKFEPIAWAQVMYVPHTKAGKFPKASFSSFNFEKKGPRHIKMTPKHKGGEIKNLKEIGDDMYSFNVEWKGKKIDWTLIARALYKIGLGMVAAKQGRDDACSEKFNAARKFILTGQDIKNNLLVRMKFKPHQAIHVVYIQIPEGTGVYIDLFGMAFILNLEDTTLGMLHEEHQRLGFELVPFVK